MTKIRSLIHRRLLLSLIGAGMATSLAGCGQPEREPFRRLSFQTDVDAEETEDGWLVSVELVKLHQGPDDLTTFHDVRVHGYDHDRAEVCSKEIGTIADRYPGGNGIHVEIECSAFPTMLTYSAAESPCDEEINTELGVMVYDDDDGWELTTYRDCKEGLPPEPQEPDPS